MWNPQDAKNRFSALINGALAGRPQHVARRGKPAVVVLSEADYCTLVETARTQRESFVDHLFAFPTAPDAPTLPRAQARPGDVAL